MNDRIKKVKCKKCKAKWMPRVLAPKKCPICQSRDWDQPAPVRRAVAGPARKAKKKGN